MVCTNIIFLSVIVTHLLVLHRNDMFFNGGMGVISIQAQNEALLIKWLWKLDRDPNSSWGQILKKLYNINEVTQLHQA